MGQIRKDCILGLDFLCKWGTAVDLAAGVLLGIFGMVKLVTPARGGDVLVGRTQGMELLNLRADIG